MNRGLRAEAQRFVLTRSSRRLAAVAAAYGVLGVTGAAIATSGQQVDIDQHTMLQIVRGASDLAMPAAMMLGILATAGEYRHGTIVPSLLASPRRTRFVSTKIVWQLLLGAAVGGVGAALAGVAGWIYLSSEDATSWPAASQVALTVLAVAAVTAIYGAIGAAIGMTIRNQTAAIAVALGWMFAVEEIVPIVVRAPGLRRWLLDGAATRVLQVIDPGPDLPPLWAALVVLGGVTVVLAGIASARTVRTDVI